MTSSTKPYFIRALHEWCTDNSLTPYVVVTVDASTQVPREFVRDGQIVLNVGYDATGSLQIDNAYLSFQARFSGAVRDLMIPIGNVMAIYAKETGEGMHFEFEAASPAGDMPSEKSTTHQRNSTPSGTTSTTRPAHLKVIK